jgi:hypothetical protein
MIYGLEKSVKYDDSATNTERLWLTDLLSHEPKIISGAKSMICYMANQLPPDSPTVIHAFYGLIVLWLKYVRCRAAGDSFGMKGDMTKERYQESYRGFLKMGFTWLQKYEVELRKEWPKFFLSQKDLGTIPEHW